MSRLSSLKIFNIFKPTGPVNNPEIMVTGLLSLLFKREGAMIGVSSSGRKRQLFFR